MRICFLNENLDVKAGMGRYGRDIVDNISKQKDVEAIVLTRPFLCKSFLLRHFPNLFINALKVRKHVKQCDIIHALDGYPYGVIAALANIGLNKKLIINGIGTYSILPLDKPIKKLLMRWAYKKADKVLCISRFTEKQLLKRIKLKSTVVINHGVNYEKFQRKFKLKPKKEKIILSVGALTTRKGYHVSIPAMAEVKKEYKDIKYYIVGGRPPEIYLDLVKKYDLGKNVHFFQDLSDEDLVKLYYQVDVFLLTPVTINNNDFEGFGLVYLEAGACGKPVIGTFNCGAEDAIINNATGLLVPQNDIRKTAKVILKILDNPELAKKLGISGKKRAQQMSWDNVVKKYIKVYEEIIYSNSNL